MSPDTVRRLQRKAVQELPNLLAKKERATRQERLFATEGDLKFRSYQELFGLDPLIRQFESTLLAAEPPWIVSIVGIGGIGKTLLADAICRRLVQHFSLRGRSGFTSMVAGGGKTGRGWGYLYDGAVRSRDGSLTRFPDSPILMRLAMAPPP